MVNNRKTNSFRWSLPLVLIFGIVSCHLGGSGGEMRTVSPEQMRLAKVNTIDSLSLCSVLNPDSIEGWERLSSLTAEAWMLIDDSTGTGVNFSSLPISAFLFLFILQLSSSHNKLSSVDTHLGIMCLLLFPPSNQSVHMIRDLPHARSRATHIP